jgi:hypothetical protein
MPRQNPYQMDPLLAQGFSSLTKALIGDPETDYQVARTNRVNELLPLEKQQMQAQIGGSNASAAAARALETLRQAQTLTEEQLRDPRVQTEIAKAEAEIALAGQRDANAAYIGSQQATEDALRGPRVTSEQQLAAEREAQAQSRIASALLTDAQTTTEDALRGPKVTSEQQLAAEREAQAQSRIASAMFTDAQTTTEDALRDPKVNKTNAEVAAATALAGERDASADLSRAKTNSENQIILNPGQTIITTSADGQRQEYTAPKRVEVVLEPGEEAVVINADGTQTRLKGPPGTKDPKDGAAFLEGIDGQLNTFFESEAWSKVSPTLSRRIRSAMTAASKGQDLTTAAERIQALMSDTYKGQNIVELQGGWGDGAAFYVPGYILNFISDAIANNSTPKASKISKEYGFSLQEAKSVLKFLGVQNG